MTSNQLNYWKLKEDERANKAKEAETQRSNLAKEQETYRSDLAKEAETHRANVTSEEIRKVVNDLEKEGLKIRNNENLLKYIDMVQKYGSLSFSQLPQDYQDAITGEFGMSIDSQSKDWKSWIASVWDEMKRVVGGVLGGGKGISSLLF